MNESVAVSVKSLDKIAERTLRLEQTCPGYCKEPSGEEFTIVRLIAEADLPPLRSGTDPSFCNVVGGLDSIMIQKSEQAVPVIE